MRLTIPALHRCQGVASCQAWTSRVYCARCLDALRGRAVLRIDQCTADILTADDDVPVYLALTFAEMEEQLVYGVAGSPVPRGLIHAK